MKAIDIFYTCEPPREEGTVENNESGSGGVNGRNSEQQSNIPTQWARRRQEGGYFEMMRNFRGDNACVRMRNFLPTKNQQGEHHLPKLGKNLVCLKNRKKLE